MARVVSSMVLALVVVVAAGAGTAHAAAAPGWDKVVTKISRFKILKQFNNEAVLDTETGLVWERDALKGSEVVWGTAVADCYTRSTGNRFGWRPPTISELQSLADPTHQDPAMVLDKAGNPPFLNLRFGPGQFYWSVTSDPSNTNAAMAFVFAGSGAAASRSKNSFTFPAWCVRGPGGENF